MLTTYSKKSKLPKSNISRDERKALCSLRKDSNCMVFTADKDVALVVMDKDTYIEKCMTLLSDHRVYQEYRDHTNTIYNRVIKQLTDLKTVVAKSSKACAQNYTSWRHHKFHKPYIPLRPIISACGTSTYKLPKFLRRILQKFTGKNSSLLKIAKTS